MSSAGIANIQMTIASGATDSSIVDVGGSLLVGVMLPTMTGATFTIKNSVDGIDFSTVCDDSGNAYTVIATDGAYVALDTFYTAGLSKIQFISATGEAAQRVLYLATKAAA
jgi:hypothetical protein